MAREIKKRTTKRFGARYGVKVRVNVEKIESILRQRHKCPYCNTNAVKRIAVGIWKCRKCRSKFTGKAYQPGIAAEKFEEPPVASILTEKQNKTATDIKEK